MPIPFCFILLYHRWQETFLDRLLVKVVAKINASKKNQEEKMVMKTEVEKRLRTLENETEDVSARSQSHKNQFFVTLRNSDSRCELPSSDLENIRISELNKDIIFMSVYLQE